jgi:hypothetical protein
MTNPSNKTLSPEQTEALIQALKIRFEKYPNRHACIAWLEVEERLRANPKRLWSLYRMEETAGEPDVVGHEKNSGNFIFYDCSAESPAGRRSICYDPEALESRKENKPQNSALGMAAEMGIEILTEKQYRELQKLEKFDTKTSSWIYTPAGIRKLGGALFADFRYGTVFVYHNGAESYYAARGFRGWLRI